MMALLLLLLLQTAFSATLFRPYTSPTSMVNWYQPAKIVQNVQLGGDALPELVRMAERDKQFKHEIDTDITLRKPFAYQILVHHKKKTFKEPFLDHHSMERIREGLLNRSRFAMVQKNVFMENAHVLPQEERKKIHSEVDDELGIVIYFMEAFVTIDGVIAMRWIAARERLNNDQFEANADVTETDANIVEDDIDGKVARYND